MGTKIAIAAKTSRPDVVAAVRAATGQSLAQVKQHLAAGTALVEGEPYDDMPGIMRAVVAALKSKGGEALIYLLNDDQSIETADPATSRIPTETFENMLARAEGLAGR